MIGRDKLCANASDIEDEKDVPIDEDNLSRELSGPGFWWTSPPLRRRVASQQFSSLLHCVNAADINAYGIKYGNINAKSTVDESLNIDDGDITIVYGIGGHSDQVRNLRRADIGGNEYVKKMENESSIYVSDTADIIYHHDLKRDGTTVSYGFVYENGVLQYFNRRGQVLVLPENKAGAEYSKLAPG
ncbi:hypothetical protein DPMN_134695 [Dreissena polymorpha]|uniref:Uncharacterized protein n=1 Tax=Dreissena polymorpha TaxID=45954 RepID=A0A9D4JE11_DREPO|nr:hypothetical protein DPMN_134695 [Dreissena polymorpha]